MAKDLKTADNTPAVQIAIVEFVLFDDVVIEAVEVLFGQQLSGEKPRAAQAFEPSTSRTNRLQGLHA
jgi:hypothetical protein